MNRKFAEALVSEPPCDGCAAAWRVVVATHYPAVGEDYWRVMKVLTALERGEHLCEWGER